MAIRYTAQQLLALRESPLVSRPDRLQPIESYLDDGGSLQDTRKRQTAKVGLPSQDSTAQTPMGSFSTGRPTLGTRGSTARGNGDDATLGPPKTIFASSRSVPKLSDVQDKGSGDLTLDDEPENPRSKFFSDRNLNRRSMNEKDGGESNGRDWANVRERRGQRDSERFGSREEKDDGERRNGFGNRQDPRWPSGREDRQNGDRRGGWREREARRDRDHDRQEKEPEWLDEPVAKQEKELGLGMAKTQDEFQKWKESMNKKNKVEPEKVEQETPPAPEPAPALKPTVAPLKLEAFDSSIFSNFGNASGSPQSTTTPSAGLGATKVGGAKKSSRFASMFKPAEPEPALTPAPIEEQPVQDQSANGVAKTSAEDHEGFNRVLAMLGSAKLSQPSPPTVVPPSEQTPASPVAAAKPTGTNGTTKKSRFTDMFAQKSPERLQSPQQGGIQLGDSLFGSEGRPVSDEPSNTISSGISQRQHGEQPLPRSREPASNMSPAPSGIPFNAMREQQPRPGSDRNLKDMFDPPSRSANTPDVTLQNLLAQQRQRPQVQTSDSQALLNLLKKDTSRPASQQALPHSSGMDLQHWIESQHRSPMPQEPHAPKPRVPQQPPGLFEEQLMRNYTQDPQMLGLQDQQQRRSSQRAPPGFVDEHSLFLQQQQQQQLRRQQQQQQQHQQHQHQPQFAEPPPPPPQPHMQGPGRRMSGHPNLPQMQIPQQQFSNDLHQLTSPGGAPPPPGFGHRPQGLPGYVHNVNIFQGAQQDPQQRGPPPPGFGMQSPMGNAPPPGFFGAPQGMPPGFQQIRSPIDALPPGMRYNGMDPRR